MNNFDEQVLNGEGNAQEKLLRLFGKQLNYNNAKKIPGRNEIVFTDRFAP